jgi:mannitol/fructose-specific phosphotransferase system IIA component (Ntr-type)
VSDVATDRPTEIVFRLRTPTDNAQEHLQLIGAAASTLRRATMRRRLAAATRPAEVLPILAEHERR